MLLWLSLVEILACFLLFWFFLLAKKAQSDFAKWTNETKSKTQMNDCCKMENVFKGSQMWSEIMYLKSESSQLSRQLIHISRSLTNASVMF